MIAPDRPGEGGPSSTLEEELRQADHAFHEATAHLYDEVLMPIFGAYYPLVVRPTLDALVAAAPGTEALDIGCGTAGVTIELAHRGLHVTGLDHSPAMLALAEQKLEQAGLADRVQLLTGDVRKLPFDDASFDTITCQGVLHHLPTADGAIEEIARVLRPQGVFFLSEPCEGSTPTHEIWQGAPHALRRLRALRNVGKPVAPPPPLDIPDHEEGPMDAVALLELLERHSLVAHPEYWSTSREPTVFPAR